MNRRTLAFSVIPLIAACASLPAQQRGVPAGGAELPTISEKAEGLERHDGFIPFYYDRSTGAFYLEVDRAGREFLYLNSLATGLGSAALGLDRGTIGDEAVVRFERHGPKVFLVRTHPGFRATTENAATRESVAESFAVSVIGGFPIVAEEDGRLLVEATDFFLKDMFGVAERLEAASDGGYGVDRSRSAIYIENTKAFPENTEVEATLTFAGSDPGREVSRHAPDGRSVTLRQHHSFVKLPDPGYEPRAFDPRLGVDAIGFYDFSEPLENGYQRRWIERHRLVPSDTAAWRAGELVEPVEPIVYYLDPGIPEPYRSAFKAGAAWWNEAFEAAGFENAFIVKDMPPGMDPMDARYNVIQWVHRSEPAYSIGPSYVDPRTGEIIKAAVRMDSYRSITDYNIWAGARPAVAGMPTGAGGAPGGVSRPGGDQWNPGAANGALGASGIGGCMLAAPSVNGGWLSSLDPLVTGEEFAMARRRQHVAHEIGHTLGLAHNFIAASYGRASVMDYPAPLIKLRDDGSIDLTDAYRNGTGAYDSIAIRYAYTPFMTDSAEAAGLADIVREALNRGLRFITGGDAANSSSIPLAHRWINGSDVIAELDRITNVRNALVDRFSAAAIQAGQPMALLNRRFAPVYLHHRYALEAAIKVVGGMDYTYALKGDGQTPTEMFPPERQRAALDRLIAAIQPEALAIPERIVTMIPPAPYGYDSGEWMFESAAGPAFDPIAVARTLAAKVVNGLLHPERAARLVSFHARNPDSPGLSEVVTRLLESTWRTPPPEDPMYAALQRVAGRAVLDRLIDLAANPEATVEVRAIAEWQLAELADRLDALGVYDPTEKAFRALAVRDIRRFLDRGVRPTDRSEPADPPAGTPINQATGGATGAPR